MALNDDLLNEIADAILDGAPIDWSDATSRAAGRDSRLLDRLRTLNVLARLHRELTVTAPDSPAPVAAALGDDDGDHTGRWGHLTLLERVGRGAFGEVYRAHEEQLDRDVALKLLPAGASDGRASSIIDEGRLLARVRHPNVVTIHGAERRGDRVGLWMEFVEGRTLEQMLQAGKRFTVRETVEIGLQLCEAVAAVHDAGLLHRDIKSQNVMLEASGRAVLMDFGAGHEVGVHVAAPLAGTPLYLAPELLSGSEPSILSDVYSLGVVLYHLLTGSYPVRADSLHALRQAHGRSERADLRIARPDVPPRLARIIDRALKPKPEDRYRSARTLALELSGLRRRRSRVSLAVALSVAPALILFAWLGTLSGIGWNAERPVASSGRAPLGQKETSSAEAFRHYSFGQYHLELFNVEHMRQAEREFREAVRLDPQYARAHAALGLTLINMVWLRARQPLEIRDAAEASALTAIALDESIAVAHSVLGHVYQYFDYAPFKAQREHLRAMELDDRNPSVLRAYSFFLLHHDAFDEALDVHRRTLELDPASPLSTIQTAEMLLVARRYDECVVECRRAATLEPDDAKLLVSNVLGRCLEQQGRQQEAIEAYGNGLTARGQGALAEQLKRAYARRGWTGYWRERLRTAPPEANLAALHVRLGNIDEAIVELERAERTRTFAGSGNIPELDPLRADPRFQALRARTGYSGEINAQLAAARLAARSPAPQSSRRP